MHLPKHQDQAKVDPHVPHAFVQPKDAPGTPSVKMGGGLGSMAAWLREPDSRCAVPGCGRGRDDEIHAAS